MVFGSTENLLRHSMYSVLSKLDLKICSFDPSAYDDCMIAYLNSIPTQCSNVETNCVVDYTSESRVRMTIWNDDDSSTPTMKINIGEDGGQINPFVGDMKWWDDGTQREFKINTDKGGGRMKSFASQWSSTPTMEINTSEDGFCFEHGEFLVRVVVCIETDKWCVTIGCVLRELVLCK